jgi:hypothetical protein
MVARDMGFAAVVETEAPSLEAAAAGSGVSWAAIIAGAVAAVACTTVLLLLGTGVCLSMVSPWYTASVSATTFGVTTVIWVVIVQWLSSGLGGYLTGRLRTKWVGVHTHEVFFRDTAHGFLAWALASVVGAMLLASVSALGGLVAAKSAADVAAAGVTGAAQSAAQPGGNNGVPGNFVDALFRSPNPTAPDTGASRAEALRILMQSAQGALTWEPRIVEGKPMDHVKGCCGRH